MLRDLTTHYEERSDEFYDTFCKERSNWNGSVYPKIKCSGAIQKKLIDPSITIYRGR
jgi:hypothetical protein